MLALTVAGGAVIVAVLACQRHAKRAEDIQQMTDLQRWEGEGDLVPSEVVKLPS